MITIGNVVAALLKDYFMAKTDNSERFADVETIANGNYIPPIHVISIATHSERRLHIIAESQRLGLQINLFDAYSFQDLAEYPDFYDQSYRKKHFGYNMTPGEVGCFLSHRKLWQQCAQSDDLAWCILEDDVTLHPQFVQKMALVMDTISDWDILRLMSERWDRRGRLYRRVDKELCLMRYIRQPQGTAAYLIRPEAAQILLEHTEKILDAVDKMMDQYWLHGLRLLVLNPDLVSINEKLPSIIQERGWSAEHDKTRPLWRSLQRDLRNGWEACCAQGYFWSHYFHK